MAIEWVKPDRWVGFAGFRVENRGPEPCRLKLLLADGSDVPASAIYRGRCEPDEKRLPNEGPKE